MSRAAQTRAKSTAGAEEKEETEICPVCKTSKYMRPNMKLLVNPACWHKMCESCADRLFGHGPAKCPERSCNHTLRRNKFRLQTFADIEVEREVDIRHKVAAVFGRREDEFESLRDYNDYLNDAEDITFNMIHNIDREETQRRYDAYERVHQQDLRHNAHPERQEQLDYLALRKTTSKPATKPPKEGHAILKKRVTNKQDAQLPTTTGNGSTNLVIKGLKAKVKPEPEAPIDPFGGIQVAHKYYALQDEYVWRGLQDAQNNKTVQAGGYSLPAFTNRALCEAFSGLDIILADEFTEWESLPQDTMATTAHVDITMKDLF